MSPERIVVVGAGIGGVHTCQALRAQGYDGEVILVGDELDEPYDRPPLSKAFLQGKKQTSDLTLVSPEQWRSLQVEVRTGRRAIGIDLASRAVILSGYEPVRYDRLVVATGSYNSSLSIRGATLEGVFSLRSLRDATALREAARSGHRAVVIGAGFIGCEVAASLRQRGLKVTVVEVAEVPLLRVVGTEAGQFLIRLHRRHGVTMLTGTGVTEIRGHHRVEDVVTSTGVVIPTDLVIVAVGVRPALDWLLESGLADAGGITVDVSLRSRDPHVFAIGDVARFPDPVTHSPIRVEHWDVARAHAVHVARALLGSQQPYSVLPYFWSDVFDVTLQYAGHCEQWNQIVVRGSTDETSFSVFYCVDGRVGAVLSVNSPRDFRHARTLVEAQVPVRTAVLEDSSTDLRQFGRTEDC
ncbi:MAG: NAD(P)/FAD-dependent oxidoreductase [Chloroflexi bacterium]|nr:NAD(P)/FAD-dependent oxidoreductase [Chloroflexota bacterium]